MKPNYEQHRTRLVELTGQSNDWLAELVYHKGEAYLQERFGKVKTTIKLLEGLKSYWRWWDNQMNVRIVEFLEMIDLMPEMYHTDKDGFLTPKLQDYIFLQFMHFLATYREVYPNDVVWKLAEKELYAAVDVELKQTRNVRERSTKLAC